MQIQRLSAMILGKKKKCQSIAYNEILRKSVLFNNGFCEEVRIHSSDVFHSTCTNWVQITNASP